MWKVQAAHHLVTEAGKDRVDGEPYDSKGPLDKGVCK